MRLWKLMLLSSLAILTASLPGTEPARADAREREFTVVQNGNRGSPARLLAAEDPARACATMCQEKRDACFKECKASENPKICQGACLDAYKTCKSACGS